MSNLREDQIEAAFSWAEKLVDREAEIEDAASGPKADLWDHQVAAINAIKAAIDEGELRPIVQIPTGGGKTRIAVDLINRYLKQVGRDECIIFWRSPNRPYRTDGEGALPEGITHVGVIQSNHRLTDRTAPVQVCSLQTLMRREIPKASIVFLDEVHLQFGKIHQWIDAPEMKGVPVIGLSATPSMVQGAWQAF